MKFSLLLTTLLAIFVHTTMAEFITIVERRNMPGGYSLTENGGPQVVAAASFAVSSLAEAPYSFASNVSAEKDYNVRVAKAWRQVVAGMNFRLVILVENASGEYIGSFSVTVYDHFGELSVTKWGKEVEFARAKALLETEGRFKDDDDDFNE